MFGKRRRERSAEQGESAAGGPADENGGSEVGGFEDGGFEHGPFDASEVGSDEVERLDLGSVRFPVPEGSQLQVEVDPAGPVRAVHLLTQVGRLTVNAFAAPRSGDLWPEVSGELVEQLRKDGAKVHTERGEWGQELVADSPNAVLRFVGVDGPRWLLRGVAAGPSEHFEACGKLLYSLLDQAVVVRGEDPLPVRTPLPIELPEEIANHIRQAQEQGQDQGQAQS